MVMAIPKTDIWDVTVREEDRKTWDIEFNKINSSIEDFPLADLEFVGTVDECLRFVEMFCEFLGIPCSKHNVFITDKEELNA